MGTSPDQNRKHEDDISVSAIAYAEDTIDNLEDAELDELLNEKPLALTLSSITSSATENKSQPNGQQQPSDACISNGFVITKGDFVWAPYRYKGKKNDTVYYPAILVGSGKSSKKRSRKDKVAVVFLPAVDEAWPSRPQKFYDHAENLYPFGEGRCPKHREFEEAEKARRFVAAYYSYTRYFTDTPPPAVSAYEYFAKIHNLQGPSDATHSTESSVSSESGSSDESTTIAGDSETTTTTTNSQPLSIDESEDDSDFGKNGELLQADEPTDKKLLAAYFDTGSIEFARSFISEQFEEAKPFLHSAPLGKRLDLSDVDAFALSNYDDDDPSRAQLPPARSPVKNESRFNSPNSKSSSCRSATSSQSQTPVSCRMGLRSSPRSSKTVSTPAADYEQDLDHTVFYYFKHIVAEADATRQRKLLVRLRRAAPYPFGLITNDADKRRIRERYSVLAKETLGEHAHKYDGFYAQDFVELAVLSQVTQFVLRKVYQYSESKARRCVQFGSLHDTRRLKREAKEYGADILRRAAKRRITSSQLGGGDDEEEEEDDDDDDADATLTVKSTNNDS